MTPKLAQQLFLYRNLLVALGNGAITWVVLIIAPLGLFAVITNTALVFLGSLFFGTVGDRLTKNLLQSDGFSLLQPQSQNSTLEQQAYPELPQKKPPHFPRS